MLKAVWPLGRRRRRLPSPSFRLLVSTVVFAPDPVERRGCRVVDQRPEPRRDIEPASVSPQANGPWEVQRHSVTSRVHLTCTPGSVRGLGRRPPRSARPVVRIFFSDR